MEVVISRLPVGHTHSDIDQKFSVISIFLRGKGNKGIGVARHGTALLTVCAQDTLLTPPTILSNSSTNVLKPSRSKCWLYNGGVCLASKSGYTPTSILLSKGTPLHHPTKMPQCGRKLMCKIILATKSGCTRCLAWTQTGCTSRKGDGWHWGPQWWRWSKGPIGSLKMLMCHF